MISLTSCKRIDKQKTIISILKGIEVDSNYVYSDESILVINNKKYSLRAISEYENGKLNKITVFKSEGILEYNKQDVINDIAIAEYYGFPLEQNWIYNPNKGLIKGNQIIEIKLSQQYIILPIERNKVEIYKIE